HAAQAHFESKRKGHHYPNGRKSAITIRHESTSVGRRDADAHTQTLARVVIHARHVRLAAIAVFDVVTDDAAFGADIAHRLAAGHRILLDMIAPAPHAVADCAPRHRTCHGRGPATVTLAHRAAQHTADHGAQ